MKLNKKFTGLAAGLLTATSLMGCTTMSFDEDTSRRLGGAIGGAAGVGLSEVIQGAAGGGTTSRVIRGIGLGYLGREAGRAVGEELGDKCDRDVTIDNRSGQVTRDSSRCDLHHGTPPGTPGVVYPRPQ